MAEEYNDEKYSMAIDFIIFEDDCLDAEVKLWECEGQLKCDEPSYESDWASEAICTEGEGAPIYKGDQYSSTTVCFNSLTYHCTNEQKARKNVCH